MHRAIFVLWNAEFYMVLFSFITPQFESGAQSEVTMLRPDSPSSCLTACWHSRDVPLLGKGFSLTVFHTSRYPCRGAQGKLIMRLKQNRLCIANGPGFVLYICTGVFYDSTQRACVTERPRPTPGTGGSQLCQDMPGTSSPSSEFPSPNSTSTEKNGQSRQL